MKKQKWMVGAMLFSTLMLTSCLEDFDNAKPAEAQQGQLELTLDATTDFVVGTRALNEATYKNVENYTVVVTDKDGVEKLNCKGSEVAANMPLTLPIGSYLVKAFYGTEKPASRDEFYVYGEKKGTIKADQREAVAVTCIPTCGKVVVEFGSDMATYFADYQVTFGGTEALGAQTFAWAKADSEPWYVQLKEDGENIQFTIALTTKEEYVNSDNKEQTTTKTGTFSLSRNKAYRMKVNPSYTPTDKGNVSIEVTIDERTNDQEVEIEVPVDWL